MPAKSEFVEYLTEQLQPLGAVTARAMFGGWGFYLDGRVFAIVADETFFIKVDDGNRAEFEARGLQPFRYDMKGKLMTMAYFQPPGETMDDGEILCVWARKGVEAAGRAAKMIRKTPRRSGRVR